MFEGKSPLAPRSLASGQPRFADEELYLLSWSDLVARLDAAQDLRAIMASMAMAPSASFDAGAGEIGTQLPLSTNKRAVNREGSSNCKGHGGTSGGENDALRPTTRGSQ